MPRPRRRKDATTIELPLLPRRRGILFPNTSGPILVGRRTTLHAIDVATDGDGMVAVVTQRDPSLTDVMLADLHPIATEGGINRALRLLGSMGRVGSAYDNAMMESFFSTLQRELLNRRSWTTRKDLASAIFEWIEAWYNPRRRHTSVKDLSPWSTSGCTQRRPMRHDRQEASSPENRGRLSMPNRRQLIAL